MRTKNTTSSPSEFFASNKIPDKDILQIFFSKEETLEATTPIANKFE